MIDFEEAKRILTAFEREGVECHGHRSDQDDLLSRLGEMKKDTVRPQDRLDAEQLRRLFRLEDK